MAELWGYTCHITEAVRTCRFIHRRNRQQRLCHDPRHAALMNHFTALGIPVAVAMG